MAEIGVLEGYKHKEDVLIQKYFLRLENQLSFPLYGVAKEIVNSYRSHLDPFLNLDIYSMHRNDGIVAIW